jgi:hypothetical protein
MASPLAALRYPLTSIHSVESRVVLSSGELHSALDELLQDNETMLVAPALLTVFAATAADGAEIRCLGIGAAEVV